jgi:lipoprotein
MLKNSLFLVLLFTSFLFSCSKTENNNEEPWDLVNFSFQVYESQTIDVPQGKINFLLRFFPSGSVTPSFKMYVNSSKLRAEVVSYSNLYYSYNPNSKIMKISGQTDFFNGSIYIDGQQINMSALPSNVREEILSFDYVQYFLGTYKYQNNKLISLDDEKPIFIKR